VTVFVCSSCPEGTGFVEMLRRGLPEEEVKQIDCMSGCTRPQTVAFRVTGKVAYLFGDITSDDLGDLQRFAALYAASSDGTFADARVLGGLRMKAIARIPG
jgi:predicted metal-binding protein